MEFRARARTHSARAVWRGGDSHSGLCATRDLADLAAKGLLRIEGVGKATRYAIAIDQWEHPAAQVLPLELVVPNAQTQAAMEESQAMMARRREG